MTSFSLKHLYLFVKISLSTLLILVSPSWAGEYKIDEKKRVEAPISSTDMTRIFVEGDRIYQVFGMEGSYALETEESSGQIFIKPTDPTQRTPLKITLITESGLTQDLSLKPQTGESEAICLKSQASFKKSSSLLGRREGLQASSYIDSLLARIRYAMDAASKGLEKEVGQEISFSQGLTLKPLKRWEENEYELVLYKVTNTSSETQFLEQKDLASPQDVAVALGCPKLGPRASTSLIKICLRTPS